MNATANEMVLEKAKRIFIEMKERNKLYAIKELKPNHYSVDQATILDPKEFSKDDVNKLFQLSIALNKKYINLE